jgi:hypothetical protein
LERDVIATLLRPDHPVFEALRQQFAVCRVKSREFTGVGFFTRLLVTGVVVPTELTRIRFHLGDVAATLDGLEHGAGFVLWIENGVLATLEGFSYDEPCPDLVNNHAVLPMSRPGDSESDFEQVDRALNRGPGRQAARDINER